MKFEIVNSKRQLPENTADTIFLIFNKWNDFSFQTLFSVIVNDNACNIIELGAVKIGFMGQTTLISTLESFSGNKFAVMPDGHFSLGLDVEYYLKISNLPKEVKHDFLQSMNDIVFNNLLKYIKDEPIFNVSLMRSLSLATIENQFRRVLHGGAALTEYKFYYERKQEEYFAGLKLSFDVDPESKPRTNIHAIIGRNGIGKTTLLNGMINAIINKSSNESFWNNDTSIVQKINSDYFSSVVSVSFSAFDQFMPQIDQRDPLKGTCYSYVGLKKQISGDSKSTMELHKEFIEALHICLSQNSKVQRWIKAIETLESDENFYEIGFKELLACNEENLEKNTLKLIQQVSSGHFIVLLIIVELIW